MSVMERRLQLLLDHARYERVEAEARRSGRSVAAVIREAIDVRFADEGDTARASAAQLLVQLGDAHTSRGVASAAGGEGPAELKRALTDDLMSKLAGT
ncbi:MAG: hypothetical protein KBF43_06515 [Dermatophilaceae bacterium]|jgi:predicted DNA-binding protein|nr:antitoxin [Actinomycetales bacterium]MBP8881444.1 hypothetical protein [Dermatophilaceae bacterium]MBP9918224.1 hypothetical protein [Dermatophilaceae bacterium]